MLIAEKMNRVSVVVLKEHMDKVLEEVARVGVLHLTRIEEIEEWAKDLASAGISHLSGEYMKRQRKIKHFLEEISPQSLEEDHSQAEEIEIIDIAKLDSEIAKIEKSLVPLLTSRANLTEKITELRSFLTQVGMLIPFGLPVRSLMRSTFLASIVGTIQESQLSRLRRLVSSVPSVVLPFSKQEGNLNVICVVLRKDRSVLEKAVREVGLKQVELPEELSKISGEIESRIVNEITRLERELARIKRDINSARRMFVPQLLSLLRSTEAAILLLKIKQYCRLTDKTCFFTGWVPKEKTETLTSRIRERTNGKAIIEVVEAEKIKEVREGRLNVPVLFKHPPFLKPFQMLIAGYGIPSYRMVDPTIFVAITFLTMFGMMFGDVGHGLVLFLGGVWTALRSHRYGEIGKLIAYCGASSIAFGFLYGSFFGLETVLPTLWVKPLEGITDLFKVAIGFGVVVVSLGIILNIVNSVRTHSLVESFFDKSGPLVGMVYWVGVGIAIRYMMSKSALPHPAIFFGLFVIPLILFFLKGPILRLIGKRRAIFPEGVGTYIMEGLVEILEILMGYLANTVSFIRVAAFGLAHAGLFVAVFTLAEVVATKPGGMLLSWLVLIFGNILIILLEGLVVTIQALRLEYYEFFGKFFKSRGEQYAPVVLFSPGRRLEDSKGGG